MSFTSISCVVHLCRNYSCRFTDDLDSPHQSKQRHPVGAEVAFLMVSFFLKSL